MPSPAPDTNLCLLDQAGPTSLTQPLSSAFSLPGIQTPGILLKGAEIQYTKSGWSWRWDQRTEGPYAMSPLGGREEHLRTHPHLSCEAQSKLA